MKIVGYAALTIILVFLLFIIIPNSIIYSPLMDYMQNRAQSRWGIDIIRDKARVNIISGTLTLTDLHMKTSEESKPKWKLSIKKTIVQLNYTSFFKEALVFDTVLLDSFNFVQEVRAGSESDLGRTTAGSNKEKTSKTQSDKIKEQRKKQSRKHPRIKRLALRNGKVVINILHDSGMKQSVKAENINLARKDIVFDGNLDGFLGLFLNAVNLK